MIIYVIKPGDNIYDIARQYSMDPQKIIADNELANPEKLVVGQSLALKTDTRQHTVKQGQSFYSIARAYGITLDQLKAANPNIKSPYALELGQVINVNVPEKAKTTIDVNGYAFPNIDSKILAATLPYLTYFSIFSYQVKPDGSLITINDTPLIEAARKAKVAPMMVITNIQEGGSFSSDLAHTILTDKQVQQTLINNVLETLKSKNYYGLDIDFEYIFPDDGDDYDRFLQTTTMKLNTLGYTVTTAVAPKNSANQMGLLYQAHHYPVHGELANHVIIMTYEWGYTYGEPLAVSPLNQVRRVLEYAVTAIPSKKILMGMPNYGYDWTLPYKKGNAAKTISNTEAVNLAQRENAAIKYDKISQAPFFNYYDDKHAQHVVWFDDARSIQARLKLVDTYNLGGVSYWTINKFYPQNWLVLTSMYDIRKLL